MSGILIMYVKKYEQSKQRKMNPNKSERERCLTTLFWCHQQIFGICSKFCTTNCTDLWEKENAQDKLKTGILFWEAIPRVMNNFTEIQLSITGALSSWFVGLGLVSAPNPQPPVLLWPQSLWQAASSSWASASASGRVRELVKTDSQGLFHR